jgi:hypothetical protein
MAFVKLAQRDLPDYPKRVTKEDLPSTDSKALVHLEKVCGEAPIPSDGSWWGAVDEGMPEHLRGEHWNNCGEEGQDYRWTQDYEEAVEDALRDVFEEHGTDTAAASYARYLVYDTVRIPLFSRFCS